MRAGILATATLALATPAVAAADDSTLPSSRIVVVAETGTSPVVELLCDELRALGLTVVLEPARAGDKPDMLLAAARRAAAFAAVRMLPQRAAVEVWVNDRVTGKTTYRSVATQAGNVSGDVAVLRTVELLRVSLVELNLPRPPRGEAKAAPAVIELARSPEARTGRGDVWVGGGMLWSAGGTGGVSTVSAGVRVDLPLRLALDLWAAVPVAETRIRAEEGEALLSPRLLAATLSLRLIADGRALRATLGAGVAAAWLRARGIPSAGWSGSADDFVGVAALLRAGGALALTRRIAIVGDATVGATATRDVVRFGGREVARWGRPFVAAGLGLALGWN